MCLKFISQLIIYLIDKFNISIACCGNINITMIFVEWSVRIFLALISVVRASPPLSPTLPGRLWHGREREIVEDKQ